jgi:ATP-dependent NAD(P)H-hydrate dehydratase
VGTFLAWGKCYEDGAFGPGSGKSEEQEGKEKVPLTRIPLLAAAAGSYVTRTTSRKTFEAKRRSMVTDDMLSRIQEAFEECFEDGHAGTKL